MLDLTMRTAKEMLLVTLFDVLDEGWRYTLGVSGLGDKDPMPTMSKRQHALLEGVMKGSAPEDTLIGASWKGQSVMIGVRGAQPENVDTRRTEFKSPKPRCCKCGRVEGGVRGAMIEDRQLTSRAHETTRESWFGVKLMKPYSLYWHRRCATTTRKTLNRALA